MSQTSTDSVLEIHTLPYNLLIRFLKFVSALAHLTHQVFKGIFKSRIEFDLLVDQIFQIGIKSLPLIFVTTASIGMVMALQFGISLEKFGGKIYVPKVVSLSIIRELGPVFASMMLAARVGSGMTSEIGSMVVTEQISAIRALGTSPIQKIVIPRVLGCFIALPILCVLANLFGVVGGMVVGVNDLGLDLGFYLQKASQTIGMSDYISGISKSFFFSFFISIPACYYGLNIKGGTKGVGLSTTKSVVTACVLIMIGDYFLTKLFWVFETWLL